MPHPGSRPSSLEYTLLQDPWPHTGPLPQHTVTADSLTLAVPRASDIPLRTQSGPLAGPIPKPMRHERLRHSSGGHLPKGISQQSGQAGARTSVHTP